MANDPVEEEDTDTEDEAETPTPTPVQAAPPIAEPQKFQFEVVYQRDNGQLASEFILAVDFVAAAEKAVADYYKVKSIAQVN